MIKISGTVIEGKGEGKQLGYPTANIRLAVRVPSGVYAGEVSISKRKYYAAIYVGVDEDILEAHLLDFDGNLYGKEIQVSLEEKIREAREFDDDSELIAAIEDDIAAIRAIGE